jgi:HlyD family secretion protein
LIERRPELNWIYRTLQFQSERSFILFAGWAVLGVILVGNLVVILSSYLASHFAHKANSSFADRLFRCYVAEPFEYHLQNNSSKLSANIQVELVRVNNLVLVPALLLNSRVYAVMIILIGLFVFNPVLTLAVAGILVASYLTIYYFSRRSLVHNGAIIGKAIQERAKTLSEALGGIREVKLFSSEAVFFSEFSHANTRLADAQIKHHVVTQTPRSLLEIVAVGGVIFVTLYLALVQGGLSGALPALTLYALAGFKLMPALQQCFQAAGSIKGNIGALDELRSDLLRGLKVTLPLSHREPVRFESLELRGVRFKYQGAANWVLDNVDLRIEANQQIAFVGSSGSGKSTCIDLILGLLEPQEGQVLVNGGDLRAPDNLRRWRSAIGFVPQSIFLCDDSIAANIAFGLAPSEINEARIWEALRLAQLETFVKGLPQGLATRVGERGVQLSGGQRQRLGIARALYHDPRVLIFDEATSALDGVTEKEIVQAIQLLSANRTILVVAHRLSTIRNSQRIVMFERGRIVDSGSFDELQARNTHFRSMSGLA